jgi:two-component system NarL family sensor kinase
VPIQPLLDVQQAERARIARQLHDDPIQLLTVAVMRLDLLGADFDDPAVVTKVEDARAAVRTAIEHLRAMLFELDPPSLQRDGLALALDDCVYEVFGETNVAVEFDATVPSEPSTAIGNAVFRVAYEALTNVRDHANARHLRVTVEGDDGGVAVVITDDGRGFDIDFTDNESHGLGLSAALVRGIGGRFDIASSDRGTTVTFWVPNLS